MLVSGLRGFSVSSVLPTFSKYIRFDKLLCFTTKIRWLTDFGMAARRGWTSQWHDGLERQLPKNVDDVVENPESEPEVPDATRVKAGTGHVAGAAESFLDSYGITPSLMLSIFGTMFRNPPTPSSIVSWIFFTKPR